MAPQWHRLALQRACERVRERLEVRVVSPVTKKIRDHLSYTLARAQNVAVRERLPDNLRNQASETMTSKSLDMHWTTATEEATRAALRGCDRLPSGVVSSYLPLPGGMGLKLFPTQELRDFALDKQARAASYKLGPDVGDSFTLSQELANLPVLQWKSPFPNAYPSGPLRYGYLTRSADTQRPVEEDDKRAVIDQLKAIPELGAPSDLEEQDENFGYVDGRLVFLDFDIGSWS